VSVQSEPEDLRLYLTREPLILTVLSALALVFFFAVSALSHIYHAQQAALGQRWYARGVLDLNEKRYQPAVTDFRTALLYARDSYDYQLSLAEALIGLQRTDQARAYLINLWERQPENGRVNLELARIAARNSETDRGLRYYHNAIYATWPDDEESQRRDTRFELIEFLLKNHSREQAQAELIALAANLPDDPAQQLRMGDLFLRAQDYEHALAAYRSSLRADRHNAAANDGAGVAAFELGRYPLARRYLSAALDADSNNSEAAARLKTTELVLQMDPFQRGISGLRRDQIVVAGFNVAGDRIKSCLSANSTIPDGSPLPMLSNDWSKLKPRITKQALRRDSDLVESAMDLVFSIERQTSGTCGPPVGKDLALLLIAKLHEGN
jgi:tetratricopeptide (TPR) repeat protein